MICRSFFYLAFDDLYFQRNFSCDLSPIQYLTLFSTSPAVTVQYIVSVTFTNIKIADNRLAKFATVAILEKATILTKNTMFSVFCQFKSGRTSTANSNLRQIETQMTAQAVVLTAICSNDCGKEKKKFPVFLSIKIVKLKFTFRLLYQRNCFQPHKVSHFFSNNFRATVLFVRTRDRVDGPIGPVHVLIKNGDTVDVWQHFGWCNQLSTIKSIQIGIFDLVHSGVAPIDSIRLIVDGQIVWPEKILINQNHSGAAIKQRFFNFWLSTPVGPIKISFFGMDGKPTGLLDVSRNDHRTIATIKVGNFNHTHSRINPINISIHPVQSDRFHFVQFGNQTCLIASIQKSATNCL